MDIEINDFSIALWRLLCSLHPFPESDVFFCVYETERDYSQRNAV